jgi:predicted DCC family thiol-disulfide oxidoreductase YuxK
VPTGMTDNDRCFASVFYDADCRFCVNAARRFERVLARRGFELVPLQISGASARFGVPDDQLLAEMRLRLDDGTVFGGAAAFSLITIAFADTLAAGGNLARALCAFFAVFWTLRLIAGTFVFDMRPYLTNSYRRFGYHAINIVFAYLPVVYALAASQPHWLE